MSDNQTTEMINTGSSSPPKKPQTAYLHFMNANRAEVKAADPFLTFGELTKKLAEMWKALNEEERREYDDLAARDR